MMIRRPLLHHPAPRPRLSATGGAERGCGGGWEVLVVGIASHR